MDENAIPPPMSLSAPELGAIPPSFENLKASASSTELLHERSMIRFYQSAIAEEAELEKNRQNAKRERKYSVDIPKIQINSKDEDDIVGLERIHSLRRRLSAGAPVSQATWARRRQSLNANSDLNDVIDNKLQKWPFTVTNKRDISLIRQKSAEEERDEQEFEKIRARLAFTKQSSTEKRSIEVVEEEKWDEESVDDDYEESISEESLESSEDDRRLNDIPPALQPTDEEETYHPGRITRQAEQSQQKSSAPFEILTKPNPLPDPNFVPKPILKKREYEENQEKKPAVKKKEQSENKTKPENRNRSFSLIPDLSAITPRQRSHSLASQNIEPIPKIANQNTEDRSSLPSVPNKVVNKVAEISSFTAAGVVIPEPLLKRRKSDEEAKVVADHYGDILKNYGKKSRASQELYTDRESLKRAAQSQSGRQSLSPEPQSEELNEERMYSPSGAVADHYGEILKDYGNKGRSDRKSLERTVQSQNNRQSLSPEPQSEELNVLIKYSPTYTNKAASPPPTGKPNITSRQINANNNREKSPSTKDLSSKKTTRSKSPSPVPFSKRRSSSQSPRRFRQSTRTPSKSPVRAANWSSARPGNKYVRDTSASPMLREHSRTRKKSRSPNKSVSPVSMARIRPPKMREIMTQTSIGIEKFSSGSQTQSQLQSNSRQEELLAVAEVKVRGVVDYVTDLAMFVVACWLYLFNNELLAIPVLIIMVYRQLNAWIKTKIPKWMLRKKKPQPEK